ncbi:MULTISPECIES: hypothetical protein [unclassified Streptomyces]|uniref:hypothetical protein n=1 Tax=unclassified Streptomyces TaxID=2593676 RepID=UPI000804DAB0|nr:MULTISPECIES: hypothetical protein [unclassified Streptomyces]MYR73036.1 hypothetical protein [Streptomyces sp. SID4925]SBU95993.1 hypothetical protein YUMDRAFT_01649 [Streptomyces sp. OspMP-M45]
MGYELRRLLREALGPDITGLQRAVALEIADDANEKTRESWATLEALARWTAAKDASVVRNALKRLSAAGWEFRVPIGKGKDGRVLYAVPGTRMTFLVPPFEGVAVATPKEEQGLPHEGAVAPPSTPQGGAGAHSEGAGAPSEGAGAPPFSSPPHSPHVDKDSSPTPPAAEQHLEAFGAFWLSYPKKKAREEAKKAWIAALARGADPKRIVDAAQAYARERAQQDPTYTKYPATWLNKGCYDDEPDPAPGLPQIRAVGGSVAPLSPQATRRQASRNFLDQLTEQLRAGGQQ